MPIPPPPPYAPPEFGDAAGAGGSTPRGAADRETEPLLPLAEQGSSTCTSSEQEETCRVKGERRERDSHLRLCHLNVTHWGDAVEGLLEEPEFDIGLFCEMKLDKGQVFRLRKRLAASGWASVVHPAVAKSRSEQADEDLLTAGAAPAGEPGTGEQSQRQLAQASVKMGERVGLSAGVAIMWNSRMDVSRVPEDWYTGRLAGDEGKAMVVAVILRCRKVSVLAIDIY